MIVVSIGCPAGIGPEVSVAAAAELGGGACVLVGEKQTIARAAELVGVSPKRLVPWAGRPERGKIMISDPGPALGPRDRRAGNPSARAGAAQLAWIEAAYELARQLPNGVLVTGPVSKAAIAGSGARGATRFRGHTEWLQQRDSAERAVMCFAAPRFATSLVTTHVPLARVPRAITQDRVSAAIEELAKLLGMLGKRRPRLAVASLNPHAGEAELLGGEERRAIAPGIVRARSRLRARAIVEGPIGAETAYRLANEGSYDGVVAMYHDQATIPTKLVAFGDAVNVTMGLSVVRTSVDHGTGYDIAWRGTADARGMLAAMRLAARLARARGR